MRRFSPALAFLFLAWFCAQQPQGFVVNAVTWLRDAARFSHQQQLAAAVHVALAQAAQVETTLVASEAGQPAPIAALPLSEVVAGKVPLILVQGFDVLPPLAGRKRSDELGVFAENRARDVPVPVPRVWGRAVL